MTKIRLNYDGWLALPEAVRHKLGLATGDRLDVELVDGAVVLRPARAGGTGVAAPVTAEAPPPPVPPAPARRGPGRPRKTPVTAAPAPRLKVRGRRAAAVTAE